MRDLRICRLAAEARPCCGVTSRCPPNRRTGRSAGVFSVSCANEGTCTVITRWLRDSCVFASRPGEIWIRVVTDKERII